ncbi:hypothetical protein GGTG_03808 [Gaeumannomyces tritici R3-111a-1]|uniref:DUF7708 domain-containing protein n=1 Tax=Gaeumannomyces tritici (strain R3-111a-1) TaxID=644352 RepID=J3NRA4_GAET3|nr:hypothetical protein GGTG_03808 [Gaeumannomyces tritici R3-111a-1]EJT78710.1 hypothetical protein GGTG_03808 [Gaeumannomyces tritici R3-111a-1]
MDHDTQTSWTGDIHGDTSAIASDAFKAAKTHFEQSSSLSDQEKKLLGGSSSIEDVQQIVASLVTKYESKSDSSKTRRWLQRTSETICHYGAALDVFVQQNPEYVSLVWGTFKLLFSSVVNHGETLKLLAKATSQIATRLPRIKMLSRLYATQHMREAIESLYSAILEFLLTAHSWVGESKLRHIYHSLTRPPKLQYASVLDKIVDCSNNIFELATLGSQVEVRAMHASQAQKLDGILSAQHAAKRERSSHQDGLAQIASRMEISGRNHENKLDLIVSLLGAHSLDLEQLLLKAEAIRSLQTSAQLDTNQQLSGPQLEQILTALSPAFADPEQAYKHHLLLRKRRASGMGTRTSTNPFWLSPTLAQWSSSRGSSLAVIKGAFSSRPAILDFGTSVIQSLSASATPTLWVLPGAGKPASGSGMLTPTDLMKYLTYQALRLSSRARAAAPTEAHMALRHSHFCAAATAEEWFGVFERVISSIPGERVCLVVDMAAVCNELAPGTTPGAFNFIQELHSRMVRSQDDGASRRGKTRVKVVLLVYEASGSGQLPKGVSDFVVPVKVTRSKAPRASRGRLRGGRRC